MYINMSVTDIYQGRGEIMLFERCHDCKDRHYLCHSNCEHYERACQKKEMQKKMKRLESLANDSNYKSWGYHRKEKK